MLTSKTRTIIASTTAIAALAAGASSAQAAMPVRRAGSVTQVQAAKPPSVTALKAKSAGVEGYDDSRCETLAYLYEVQRMVAEAERSANPYAPAAMGPVAEATYREVAGSCQIVG